MWALSACRELHGVKPPAVRASLSGNVGLVQRMELQRKLQGHSGCVNTVSFDEDGSVLISGSDDQTVVLWDWQRGSPRLRFDSGHHNNVFQARVVPHTGGTRIVTCAADGQVRLAELPEGAGSVSVSTSLLGRHAGRAHKLALDPLCPQHCFFSSGEDGQVIHYDLRCCDGSGGRAGARRRLVTVHGFSLRQGTTARAVPINAVHVNPTRPWQFAVGGGDPWARVYDARRARDQPAPAPAGPGSGGGGAFVGPPSRQQVLASRAAAAGDEPVARLCPGGLRALSGDLAAEPSITCCVFSAEGELLASYNDEDIYLFSPLASRGALGGSNGDQGGRAGEDDGGGRGRGRGRARRDEGARGGASSASRSRSRSRSRSPSGGGNAQRSRPSSRRRRPAEAEADAGVGAAQGGRVAEGAVAAAAAAAAAPGDGGTAASISAGVHEGSGADSDGGDGTSGRRWRRRQRLRTAGDGSGVAAGGAGPSLARAEMGAEAAAAAAEAAAAAKAETGAAGAPASLAVQGDSSDGSGGSTGGGQRPCAPRAPPPWALPPPAGAAAAACRPSQRGFGTPAARFFSDESATRDGVVASFYGHRNAATVKGVSFFGEDKFICSGSDCGHVWLWSKTTGEVVWLQPADAEVVNCLEPHPTLPLHLATSGIESDIKLWAPTAQRSRPPPPATLQAVMASNRRDREAARDSQSFPDHLLLQLLAAQRRRAQATRRARQATQEAAGGAQGAGAAGGTSDEDDEEEDEGEEEEEEEGGGGDLLFPPGVVRLWLDSQRRGGAEQGRGEGGSSSGGEQEEEGGEEDDDEGRSGSGEGERPCYVS